MQIHRAILWILRSNSAIGILTLSALSQFPPAICAQQAAPQDIYRNFIGRWEGTSAYHADGHNGRNHVTIVITEEPKKHRMRWEYSFGSSDDVRFVQLDLTKATMEMDRDGGPEWYEVQGLREFADSGIGDFVATRSTWIPFMRYSFHLEAEKFIYSYAESRDGKNFKTLSQSTFTRQH